MTTIRDTPAPEGDELSQLIWGLPLVDHHVHGTNPGEVDRDSLEIMLTEGTAIAPGQTQFDSQVGFAIRRWSAPVLGLEANASADDYISRRLELGNEKVSRRLLRASGVNHFLNDTGAFPENVTNSVRLAELSGGKVDEIVRLEWLALQLVQRGVRAEEFPARYREFVGEMTVEAVGMKSIIAYLNGFEFDPDRPSDKDVVRAASSWIAVAEPALTDGDTLAPMIALTDSVLLRFFLWTAVDRGLPLQLHTGYGSLPIALDRANPLLLLEWLKQVEPLGIDVMLIHCYPYHREAGYLAQIFTNVYLDVGLAINYTGAASTSVIAQSLELAPFSKVLFSSDAWGPAELHHLGAVLWRRGMTQVLGQWVADGDWSLPDAQRVAAMVGRENANRVYRLRA
jgi:predicted TIM-barrel fold metal-dependent hydrolase